MKKLITCTTSVVCFLFIIDSIYSQITIITDDNSYTTGENTAVLDVKSNSKGFLPPRMTTAQRNAISIPAEGITIYNTDIKCLEFWDGSWWYNVCGDNDYLKYPSGTVFCALGVSAIVEVTNPATGKTWMDRNLGAIRVATSSTDADSYGDLYQWGRFGEGHQCRTSNTTNTLATTEAPLVGNVWDGLFITTNDSPYDWITPQHSGLWQGVYGINNPCPEGFRLPTEAEWQAERNSWGSYDAAGAFGSPLKLPMAGYKDYVNGTPYWVGSFGFYWSGNVQGNYSRLLRFDGTTAIHSDYPRGNGNSVRCIKDLAGIIGSLDCSGATINGSLTEGLEGYEVSAEVTYTGGNGGSYKGQTVFSTGVSGLTATIPAGNFAIGAGTLIYTISGTPSGSGNASFVLNIGGQTCILTTTVQAFVCGTTTIPFSYNGSSVNYGTVTSANNKCWLDRNLGASQVATSSTDAASYGDLFQWGRLDDGHQVRAPLSGTTTTLSDSDVPGHDDFIKVSISPEDWRSPQNDNLWQGVNGVNNPCPAGFRIPTEGEWNTERLSWVSTDAYGAFNSPLSLPMAGFRDRTIATVGFAGSYGLYWSSTVSGTTSRYLIFYSDLAYLDGNSRAFGYTVRCVKD